MIRSAAPRSMLATFPIPGGSPSLVPFIALSAVGFAIGVFGHIIKSNVTIATGIGLVFLGVLVLPLLQFGNGQ